MTNATIQPLTYTETRNDAGLFREYIGQRYGSYFDYGISGQRFGELLRLARRLARMTGRRFEEVWTDLAADAAARA